MQLAARNRTTPLEEDPGAAAGAAPLSVRKAVPRQGNVRHPLLPCKYL